MKNYFPIELTALTGPHSFNSHGPRHECRHEFEAHAVAPKVGFNHTWVNLHIRCHMLKQ